MAALDSARVWLTQGRFDRAEGELRGALADDPGNAGAHALLSLTLRALDRPVPAQDEARAAITADPELALGHYALAAALEARGLVDDALSAVNEALRLAPRDADAWSLLGQIHLHRRAWDEARHSADQALAIDAEHVGAINLRARALLQGGRVTDADHALRSALARDPENAGTHANVGWSHLQRGAVDDGQRHFLEALRLSPGHEAARLGLIESIKARNRLYRAMLGFFFWIGRQQKRTVWVVLIGLWVVPRILRALAKQNPALAPFVIPVVLLFAAFAYLTWIVGPLFDAILFLHPVGRHALNRIEKAGAAAVTGCLAVGLLSIAISVGTGSVATGVGGFLLLLFIMPMSAAFGMENPRRRRHATVCAAILGGLALAGGLLALVGGDAGKTIGVGLLTLFLLGIFVMGWIFNRWSLDPRTD